VHAAVMLAEGGRVKRPYRLAAALIAGLALGMGVPLSLGGGHGTALAETLSLRPDEALGMAKLAYQAGDHATANHLARALLLVDARDPLVLLLLAATEPKLGNPKAGIKAGRLAWGEARRREAPDGLRWEIARNTAKAAYDADQMGLAQWWLRRSLDVAPDKDALGVSGKDLAEVRAQNRLHWSFDLAIGPSDNLNGGASDPVFRVDDTVIGFLSNGAGAVGGHTRAAVPWGEICAAAKCYGTDGSWFFGQRTGQPHRSRRSRARGQSAVKGPESDHGSGQSAARYAKGSGGIASEP
jgi:hypothetical protein